MAQRLRSRWELRGLCHSRLSLGSRKGAGSLETVRASQPPPSQRQSLFEELFPEEVQKDGDRDRKSYDDVHNVPPLPLPEIYDISGGFGHESARERTQLRQVTKVAAANALRPQQLAVLSLDTGSKSLIESDFRGIAPKGQHIDDWTGPGDILKSGLKRRIMYTRGL